MYLCTSSLVKFAKIGALNRIAMTTKAAKIELMDWLASMDDREMLSALLFYKKANETLDWADSLTSSQKDAIREGLGDVREGRVHSSSDIWKKYGR